MPNPTAVRSGSTIVVNGQNMTVAEAEAFKTSLESALNAPSCGSIDGTLTVTAPVSKKRGNNVLHGVTSIKVANGRVFCYLPDGSQPKYENGAQHRSFSMTATATKGRRRGQTFDFEVEPA